MRQVTIPAGRHREKGWFFRQKFHRLAETIQYKVKFTQSCIFDLPEEDKYDWSKLPGIRYFNPFHFDDSFRACWRPSQKIQGAIDLSLYIHRAGQIVFPEEFTTVYPGKVVDIIIYNTIDNVLIDIDGWTYVAEEVSLTPNVGIINNTYLGGGTASGPDWTVKHDVVLYLSDIKFY